MKHTDYEFTFEGFNFMATFRIYPNGVSIAELLLESNIDDELIPITDFKRIDIIENHLGEIYNDKLFIKDNISSVYNNEIIKKLHSIWTPDRIKIVLNMIEFIDIDNGTEKSSKSVKCLEEFMIIIDQEIQEIVN